eukprot:6351969-Amphidinium_carterae.1
MGPSTSTEASSSVHLQSSLQTPKVKVAVLGECSFGLDLKRQCILAQAAKPVRLQSSAMMSSSSVLRKGHGFFTTGLWNKRWQAAAADASFEEVTCTNCMKLARGMVGVKNQGRKGKCLQPKSFPILFQFDHKFNSWGEWTFPGGSKGGCSSEVQQCGCYVWFLLHTATRLDDCQKNTNTGLGRDKEPNKMLCFLLWHGKVLGFMSRVLR